ncbi:TetR/AcrR family transcriptional regulator [Nocardioides sp.]|uniref:TetR/AcrR family transcriptional regulator n=1 Tax=Nocardioides sp. TaxID=35761 RepID=UPI002632C977|nr:TetR/AcrR family transcriptional regulator [Nocardioides sp.]
MSAQPSAREASAQRTRQALLTAATQIFVTEGVHAPIRDIAGLAQVGLGTVYRHFPSRGDLVVAVYRHQIDACVALAHELQESTQPAAALERWIDAFVDFLVTKHGLGMALQSDDAAFGELHSLMLDELVPACGLLVEAAAARGELDLTLTPYVLMRAVGNLCILGPDYEREDARVMVRRLLAGCARPLPEPAGGVSDITPA